MSKWFFPTISEVLALTEPALGPQIENPGDTGAQAEREWSAAIAALAHLLQQVPQQSSSSTDPGSQPDASQSRGVILAGPSPMLKDVELSARLQTWIFTAEPFSALPLQLPPTAGRWATKLQSPARVIPLVPGDPLVAERFCLVLTADFSLVLGDNLAGTGFWFSFVPETVRKTWEVLRPRVLLTQPWQVVDDLDRLVRRATQTEPHYQIVMQFSQFFSKFLSILPQASTSEPPTDTNFFEVSNPQSSGLPPSGTQSHIAIQAYDNHSYEGSQNHRKRPLDQLSELSDYVQQARGCPDVELLQAIAHEVRTPLATINTLTRLLLKRSDLPSEVVQRLETIHRECTEQIDRFSLIFRAAELGTSEFGQLPVQLTSVSLAQVLQESIPRWRKRVARRNLTLHVALPQQMPAVVSDPTMLDQVLTGLVDRFTRSLAAGSHIYIQVTLAGEQLKLQLRSQANSVAPDQAKGSSATPVLKSIGQLLMLQPETGSLSLSLPVTKNLFQALGGKLTVRKQPQQGEILTIFLPLGPETNTTSQSP